MLFIGIDLGTSSVKLVLTDETGRILREASRDYSLLQPAQGWKEIWPQTWWAAAATALDTLLDGMDRKAVAGIGVTGQMHTVVLLDEQGQPIRPALMWNDTRTKGLIPEIKQALQGTDAAHIASFIFTGSPAANLLWFRREEPALFERLRKFLIGPDYIVFRLTGVYGTDYCEASTSSLFNFHSLDWSPVMREIVGLPESAYPAIRGSAEIAGTLLPEVAAQFGLREDVTVIAGTGDNPAASISTGCLGRQYPVLSLGTSGVLMFPKEAPDFNAKGKNILFSFDGRQFHTLIQGVVQSCGSGYNWWNQTILGQSIAEADREIDVETLGENRLLFYPHLVGDKNLYADPDLRGAFLGLSADTTRADMTQAVMEGIAYGVRQLAEAMCLPAEELAKLKAIGGGAESRVWMQILSDVLNTPIDQLEGNTGAGYGMALLAAYSRGAVSSLEGISQNAVCVKERFLPHPRHVGLYEEGYRRYLKIHDAVKAVFA